MRFTSWHRPSAASGHDASPKRAIPRPRQRGRRVEANRHPAPRWLPAVVLGAAGFVALVYEVVFTRALAIALGPTTYAFAAMSTAFISGLAIGAALTARPAATASAAALSMGWLMLAGRGKD